MQIEISTRNNNREDFKHEGYYDSIDEAIAWLKILKQQQVIDSKIQQHKTYQALKIAKQADCNKCVLCNDESKTPCKSKYNAVTQNMEFFCPPEHHYKRDPPDGGYYG